MHHLSARVMLVLASLSMAVLWPHPVAAQGAAADPVLESLNAKVSYFLERVSAKDEENAFAELLEGSQLAKKTTAVQGLVDKAGQLQEKYGDYQESEQISAKRIGHDLVLLKYLFKCKNFPVVWYFTYYRDFNSTPSNDEDNWVVIGVRFDTQLDLLGL